VPDVCVKKTEHPSAEEGARSSSGGKNTSLRQSIVRGSAGGRDENNTPSSEGKKVGGEGRQGLRATLN